MVSETLCQLDRNVASKRSGAGSPEGRGQIAENLSQTSFVVKELVGKWMPRLRDARKVDESLQVSDGERNKTAPRVESWNRRPGRVGTQNCFEKLYEILLLLHFLH